MCPFLNLLEITVDNDNPRRVQHRWTNETGRFIRTNPHGHAVVVFDGDDFEMTVPQSYIIDALADEFGTATVELDHGPRLTSQDPEFHRVVVDPRLSAELAEVREPRPEPTTALLDGSARARRDSRIAQRALGGAAPVLQLRTGWSAPTDGEAA